MKYVAPAVSATSAYAPKPAAVYTCAMHPQIRLPNPGACPICGMTLELVAPVLTEQSSIELTDMTHRFWMAVVFSVPLLWLTMGHDIGLPDPNEAISRMAQAFKLPHLLSVTWSQCLQGLLATPVVLWAGWPFLARGWRSFTTWQLNMFSLVAIGVGAAYCFSLFVLFFPASVPGAFRRGGELPSYFEASSVIVALILLGQVLELRNFGRGREPLAQ